MSTIDGQNITGGHIRFFEREDWFGELSTDSSERISNGKRIAIEAQGLTLSGAIVRGGISGDVGRYQVAGRPEWDTPLPSKGSYGYSSANSVLLKTVLSGICKDALGANWETLVSLPASVPLNTHYERPGTKAGVVYTGRELLALLGLAWYVRNDGVTVFGERPSGNVALPDDVRVESRNDAIGFRVVNTESPAAFAPGLTFENEVIGELVYVFGGNDLKLHTWTRKGSDPLAALVKLTIRRAFPKLFFQGVHTYQTVGASTNGKHDLRSIGSRWLPDVQLAESWPGIAGVRYELSPGSKVLLAFADSEPAKPVVVAVEPSAVPVEITHDATAKWAANATSVELGAATSAVVVDSVSLQNFFTNVNVATGVPVPVGYTSTKVKA